MSPTLKRVGFTLSRSTAATWLVARAGVFRTYYDRTSGLAPRAWPSWLARSDTRPQHNLFVRILPRLDSLASRSCHQTKTKTAPKGSQAWGLKVVCSPAGNFRIELHRVQLIQPIELEEKSMVGFNRLRGRQRLVHGLPIPG